jgi:hypothetical protein
MFASPFHLALTFTNAFNTHIITAGSERSLPGMFIEEGFDQVGRNFRKSLNDGETVQVQVDAIVENLTATFFRPLNTLLQQMDGMTDAAFVSRGKNTLHPVSSVACCCLLFLLFVVSSR